MSNSKVNYSFDIMLIRLGLLISDTTHMAGDLDVGIWVEREFQHKRSFQDKINAVGNFLNKNPNKLSLLHEDFDKMVMNYNFLKTVKYKTPPQINQLKAIEKIINHAYVEKYSFYIKRFTMDGLLQLAGFAGKVLYTHPIQTISPENAVSTYYTVMSKTILDRFEPATSNDIYTVSGNFSEFIASQNILTAEFGNHIPDAKLLTAQHVFTMSNIIHLTTNQLDIVRQQLLSAGELFRINMKKWNDGLLTLPFVHQNFESISSVYSSDIQPHLLPLQQEMDKSAPMNLIKKAFTDGCVFKINFYVTNIGFYWDYLLHVGVIGQETMDIIKNIENYASLKNNSCLIIEGVLYEPDGKRMTTDNEQLNKEMND